MVVELLLEDGQESTLYLVEKSIDVFIANTILLPCVYIDSTRTSTTKNSIAPIKQSKNFARPTVLSIQPVFGPSDIFPESKKPRNI